MSVFRDKGDAQAGMFALREQQKKADIYCLGNGDYVVTMKVRAGSVFLWNWQDIGLALKGEWR